MDSPRSSEHQNEMVVPLKKSLRFRLTAILIVVPLLLGCVMVLGLTYIYQSRIDVEYIGQATTTSKLVASLIDSETIDRYLSTLEKNEEYERILNTIRLMKRSTDVRHLYIVRYVDGGGIFVFDAADDDGWFDLGEVENWHSHAYESPIAFQLIHGERVDPYITNTNRWGWLVTAFEPIYRDNGSVAAYVGVDISMDEIMQERTAAFALVGLIVLLIFAISVVINLYVLQKFVISPIRLLIRELSTYRPGAIFKPAPKLRMNDELAVLERSMIDMSVHMNHAIQAERMASAAKTSFLSHMSHEFRTPLNAIIHIARESMNTTDREKKIDASSQIIASSQELLSVLNIILEVSNIESGQLTLSNAPFRIHDLIHDLDELISTQCRVKNIQWAPSSTVPGGLVVEGDKTRLAQVLAILLKNAVKYTDEQGAVIFSAKFLDESEDTACIRFDIADTGIGMTEKECAELSNMFAADDSSKIQYSSKGVMLSVCDGIVRAMGGHINVKSEAGKGSAFSFELCLQKAVMLEEAEEIGSADVDFTGRQILVVDDVATNRFIVNCLLAPTGARIIEAGNGAEAVELFSANLEYIDLILMDITMPNMDGYEATRKIRASGLPTAHSVPIIALTAHTYQEDIEAAIESGMNAHLGKPVEPERLISVMRQYLHK